MGELADLDGKMTPRAKKGILRKINQNFNIFHRVDNFSSRIKFMK